jgi:hypothetical protein
MASVSIAVQALSYRLLKPEEFDRLKFIFQPRGLPLPDPLIERVAVAEENGQIVGMMILRLLPLVDGLWVEPQHRGGAIDYNELLNIVEEPVRAVPGSRCYTLISGKHTEHIAERSGYKPVNMRVFEKEF